MDIKGRNPPAIDAAASESRYRLMFERNPLPMWVYDAQSLRFLEVNEAAIEHYGYSREEFLAMTLRDIRPPEDLPAFEAAIFRQTKGVADVGIWRHRKKDGAIALMSIDHENILIGDRPARLSVLRDVTERVLAERRRQQVAAELAQRQKLETVGTLAAGVAHDFSNLITAIQGHVALADRALPSDHVARKSLRMVERVAQQGVSMTRNLLSFAHQLPSTKQPCNLTEVVAEFMHLFRHLVPPTIQVSSRLSDAPVWVVADRTQLQQVLMNLLINARDAMPQGGRIDIALVVEQPPDEPAPSATLGAPQAVLSVSDTGTGMDEATLARVFEPFFTTKARGEGSGLGLAMVHSIIVEHGGAIVATSNPGAGARFEIHLPLCPPPQEASPPAPPAAPAVAAPRKRTVLLVGVEDYLAEIMITTLEAAGYPVRVVADPAALADDEDGVGDNLGMMVVDIDAQPQPPSLDLLRMHTGDVPVIMVTSNTARFLDDLPGVGVEVLPKPFQMSQLIQQVDQALGVSIAGAPATQATQATRGDL